MEKLNVFFDGVQNLVSAGVKESEVGFQLAYSKQELRRVIAIYPGKEVRMPISYTLKRLPPQVIIPFWLLPSRSL